MRGFVLGLALAVGVTGCCLVPTSAPAPSAPTPAAPAMPAVPAAPAAAPGLPAPPSFGVPECDHYAALACNCSNATMRAALCGALAQQFAAWQTAAAAGGDLARQSIATGCRNMEASVAANQCPGTVVPGASAAPDPTAAGAAGIGAAAMAAAGVAPAAQTPTWDGTTTFECDGVDRVVFRGQTITTAASPAISASGECDVTLVDMTITAPVVIEASGTSAVHVTGGALTGREHSIEASGMAHVDVAGAAVVGSVDREGMAVVTGVDGAAAGAGGR